MNELEAGQVPAGRIGAVIPQSPGVPAEYFEYYNRARCHLSLAGDAQEPRPAQGPELGKVVELPEVGGLHHRYERAAA